VCIRVTPYWAGFNILTTTGGRCHKGQKPGKIKEHRRNKRLIRGHSTLPARSTATRIAAETAASFINHTMSALGQLRQQSLHAPYVCSMPDYRQFTYDSRSLPKWSANVLVAPTFQPIRGDLCCLLCAMNGQEVVWGRKKADIETINQGPNSSYHYKLTFSP